MPLYCGFIAGFNDVGPFGIIVFDAQRRLQRGRTKVVYGAADFGRVRHRIPADVTFGHNRLGGCDHGLSARVGRGAGRPASPSLLLRRANKSLPRAIPEEGFFYQDWPGAPMATGRTGEPEPPFERSGRMIVHEVQTLSLAMAARLAF